jgi:hypothetical protein
MDGDHRFVDEAAIASAEPIETDQTPRDKPRPDPERVAQRAYERFQSRGGEHGRHQDDWFEAERDLTE